jgi:hypothetical protein
MVGNLRQQHSMRILQRLEYSKRDGCNVYGTCRGSQRKYGHGDGDLGDGRHQDGDGDDNDHSASTDYGYDERSAGESGCEYDGCSYGDRDE